ncbi:MAG: helix-turn-helix domain-containing protein, partial [Parahaliea sp.]
SIDHGADTRGLNLRTQQRRLEQHKETFASLINGVRRDLAMRYMANEHYSMSQIADLLGYSMPSSFTRWFITQFGAAPARWRAEHGELSAGDCGDGSQSGHQSSAPETTPWGLAGEAPGSQPLDDKGRIHRSSPTRRAW